MELLTQLNRAMDHIEEHICDDMRLADVSSVTDYSEYHFCRLFYYIAGMPLSEYIRRRKLSLAAMDLQGGRDRVIDLAVKYGYDSADSFTRAFARQHGVTPTAARNHGVSLTIFPPITFQIKIKGVQEMNWRIESKGSFEVFGIERIFGNDETAKVPDFWTECINNGSYEKLFHDAGGEGSPLNGRKGACIVNAVCGYEPGENFFPYMICAVKKDGCNTDGYKTVHVPAAVWAVFRGEESGKMGAQIPELFNRAYSEWLPSSGYDKAAGPDMEIYGVAEGGKYFEEVWIPVKKK